MSEIPTYINLWLEVGLLENTLWYINVNKLYGKIGGFVCKASPAYQGLAGSDHIDERKMKLPKIHSSKWNMMKL